MAVFIIIYITIADKVDMRLMKRISNRKMESVKGINSSLLQPRIDWGGLLDFLVIINLREKTIVNSKP